MPYVQRAPDGSIIALWAEPQSDGQEFLPPDHADIAAFVGGGTDASTQGFSSADDLRMVRVIEDLIDILIQKNVIVFTDLPEAAREKILAQRGLRERLFGATSPLNPDDGIF